MSFQTKNLGELCEFQGGSQPAKSNFVYEPTDGYVRFLQIRDFGSEKNHTYIPVNKKNKNCNSDDIMIGRYGASVGKILRGRSGAYNVALMKASPVTRLINKEFFWFYLNSYFFQNDLRKVASRSAQDGFSKDDIFNFQVPLPSLAIQQKIVAKLDAIFAKIDTASAAAEANANNAEALFQSYLTEVFERGGEKWKKMQIGSISKVINGHAFKSTDFNSDKGVKCLKITNVGIRKFIPDTNEYLPNSFAINHSNFLVNKGAIVIPLTRTIINGGLKVAIVPPDFHNSLLNQRVASIEVMPEIIDSELIYYYLSSSIVKSYVRSHVNTLMQPNLSIKDLLSMPVPIPPLELQLKIKNTISRNIDSISQIKELNIKRTDECNFLKQSILKQAFADELVKAA